MRSAFPAQSSPFSPLFAHWRQLAGIAFLALSSAACTAKIPLPAASGSQPVNTQVKNPTRSTQGFSQCPQFFANGKPPVLNDQPKLRALCYDAFAVLHSGQSKTPVFVAQRLN